MLRNCSHLGQSNSVLSHRTRQELRLPLRATKHQTLAKHFCHVLPHAIQLRACSTSGCFSKILMRKNHGQGSRCVDVRTSRTLSQPHDPSLGLTPPFTGIPDSSMRSGTCCWTGDSSRSLSDPRGCICKHVPGKPSAKMC